MKKLMITMCAGFAAVTVFAQDAAPQQPMSANVPPAQVAKQSAVEEVLLDEDGVAIVTAPDGSYQIFSVGSAVCMFIDPKAERNARKVAKLNAQKNFAEFIKTKVVGSDSVEDMQKQSRTMTGDGKVQSEQASLEDLEEIKSSISANTEAVINGLVTLESLKIPVEGTTKSTIQVKMVYSSKTAKASLAVGKKLQNHQAELQINEAKNAARVNAARQAVQGAGNASAAGGAYGYGSAASAGGAQPSGANAPVNKAERRVNRTEY